MGTGRAFGARLALCISPIHHLTHPFGPFDRSRYDVPGIDGPPFDPATYPDSYKQQVALTEPLGVEPEGLCALARPGAAVPGLYRL